MRMGQGALSGLLLEIRPLVVLHSWEAVGSRLESLTDSLQGVPGAGISEREVLQLRLWSQRWASLHPQVRGFYTRRVPDLREENEVCRVALWCVFNGRSFRGAARGALYSLWEEDFGSKPDGIEIAPTRIVI